MRVLMTRTFVPGQKRGLDSVGLLSEVIISTAKTLGHMMCDPPV